MKLWQGSLLVLTALLLACPSKKNEGVDAGPVDAGPRQLSEAEPNDQPEKALQLSDNSVVSASLGSDPSKPDEDWYLLTAQQPKTVRLQVSGIPGADMAVDFYDQDRNRMATVNSAGVGQGEGFPNLSVRNKTYVKVYSTKKGAGGAYTLSAFYEEALAGFELEPNDRAVDATPVALGIGVTGYVGHVEDQDWYRYELPGANLDAGLQAPVVTEDGGVPDASAAPAPVEDAGMTEVPKIPLRIDLSGVDGVRYDLSVVSAAEAPLFTIKGKDGEGLQLRNVGVRATDQIFYVVVKSAWNGTGKDAKRSFNADKSYTLTVAQEEAGANAETEPNDDRAHASQLPNNGFREGFLSPKGDQDYFVLRADQPTLARVQLTGVERLDLQLTMVGELPDGGEADVELLKANEGGVKEPEMLNNVFCSGECFFKVDGARKKVDGKWVADYENAEMPYRLSVVTLPDNGSEEREPNNTPDRATPIALGKAVRGTVYPKKDTDLYVLDLSARPVKTSLKATLLGILKVDVGLYLHQLGEDGKLSLVQTADRAKGDKPETIAFSAEPGVYVFEVRDSKNRESNFQDSYQLVVEEGE
ncbi:MAG: ABC transporter substrate-binding protein [Myxococcaceae bacterium]